MDGIFQTVAHCIVSVHVNRRENGAKLDLHKWMAIGMMSSGAFFEQVHVPKARSETLVTCPCRWQMSLIVFEFLMRVTKQI